MSNIFNMDDDDIELSNDFGNRLQLAQNGSASLNYKLLDEDSEKPNVSNVSISVSRDEELGDTVSELPIPIPIKGRRRGSSVSKHSSSFEIDINESFVSSLNNNSINSSKFTAPFHDDSPTTQPAVKGFKPKLSDFEPLKVLGKGSYGKVLLVREKSTGRLFAQKQLKKASLIINEINEIHQTNYKRTLNEREILEKVRHPNIVKLFYAFQDHNKVYLILEYLDGGELFHHLAQEKFMSEKNSAYYIAQAILAIRYLHRELKVIYRDLKPENCMLNSDGNLVLTDFGLSKVSSEDAAKHSIIGTAQYMAPEVLKGDEYDYSVDWWSLGCVAFDLLTGAPPFTGNNNKKIMDKIISAKKNLKFPFYLSADAKDFLRKLLQPNPDKRLNIDDNFAAVKQHRFFRFVNWQHLELLADDGYRLESTGNPDYVLPPILPVITDPVLAENFDDEFTEMPFTPPKPNGTYMGNAHDGNADDTLHVHELPREILHIRGFSFTNEDYLSSGFR